jgi:hypothetical protein
MLEDTRQSAAPSLTGGQSSPLIQRLDRRRTKLIGVIDKRPVQLQAVQLPRPIGLRFVLLNQLQNRYFRHDLTEAPGVELVLAHSASMLPPEESTDMLAKSSTVSAENPGNALPVGKFRISRKTVPLTAKSDFSDPSEVFANVFAALEVSRQRCIPAPAEPASLRTAAPFGQALSKAPHRDFPLVQRKAIPEAIPRSTQASLGRSIPAAQSSIHNAEKTNEPSPLPINKVERSVRRIVPISLRLPIQRKENRLIAAESASLPTRTEFSAPLLRSGVRITTSLPQRPPERVPSATGSANVATHAAQHLAAQLLNGSIALADGIAMRPPSRSRPEMIWRKSIYTTAPQPLSLGTISGNTSFSLPLTSAPFPNAKPIAQRSIQSGSGNAAPDASFEPVHSATPLHQPLPLSSGVDVIQLAEQVSRLLCRQLRIERERRGIRR